MSTNNGWFAVDRAGLAKIAGRRNKNFILRELVQNSWDENSTEIHVEVVPPSAGGGFSTIRVTDDSPEGFKDLSHAYTLFAPSKKVADAMKRGRFNFGEKLVLALCAEARICTTTGTILFERGENRRRSPKKREAGSVFEGKMKLNAEERETLLSAARSMLVPEGKRTLVNGEEVLPRTPIKTFEWTLETEVAKDDGVLEKTYRTATLRVFEPLPGEAAHLFEMGIPVVPTGDKYHVDIGQKVPLNLERDNVNPRYLQDVRVAVANHTAELLTSEDANKAWARDALADWQVKPEVAAKLVELRFGPKAVTFDPSDQEANSIAVSQGYTLVHGSQMNSDEWEQVRKAGALLPAGKVTPSPKPFTPGGRPLRMVEEATPGMDRFVRYAEEVAHALTGKILSVLIADDDGWAFNGAIGNGVLHVNAAALGRDWFNDLASPEMNAFLIHELGHTVESNHLSERYHEALCEMGGKLARLALDRPEVFK